MIQDKLIPVNLEQEMKKSFIAYAMAVIVAIQGLEKPALCTTTQYKILTFIRFVVNSFLRH